MKTDADTTVFGNITAPMTVVDFLESVEPLLGDTPVPLSGLDALWQNLVESFYHLVRMDLGVIIDNQIYNSPEMYNQTIIGVPSDLGSAANSSRKSTSNATLMAEWQKKVDFLQNSDRVPVMEYLRPVSRMKPVGSAITSVFVSTFAMLSAMWTVFSLVAGALARRRSGEFLFRYLLTSLMFTKIVRTSGLSLMQILGARPGLMGVVNQVGRISMNFELSFYLLVRLGVG
jgi:hypothetical protein